VLHPISSRFVVLLPITTLRLWERRRRAELLHDGGQIRDTPMLGDLAVLDTHGVDRFELDRPARCRHAEERAFLGAVIRLECCDYIAVGGLPVRVLLN
jgi:hypothetical protein